MPLPIETLGATPESDGVCMTEIEASAVPD